MKSKLTPGPWIAECVGNGGDHDNPTEVYEVTNGHTRIAEYLTGPDAKFIAAARDVVAFADELLQFLEPDSVTDQQSDATLLQARWDAETRLRKALESVGA